MGGLTGRVLALFIGAALCVAVPSQAAVKVVLGDSWDGPSKNLQSIVDGLYGAGQIDVKTDYLGAKAGDPDPWFWVDNQFSALLVKEVAGNADYNQLGWYEETGSIPVLKNDGVHDGLVFDGPAGAGAAAIVSFSKPMTRFGFYLNPNGPGNATNAPEPEKFYTNRSYNDAGPDGSGALHLPLGGDMQALVYDISRFKGDEYLAGVLRGPRLGREPRPAGPGADRQRLQRFHLRGDGLRRDAGPAAHLRRAQGEVHALTAPPPSAGASLQGAPAVLRSSPRRA